MSQNENPAASEGTPYSRLTEEKYDKAHESMVDYMMADAEEIVMLELDRPLTKYEKRVFAGMAIDSVTILQTKFALRVHKYCLTRVFAEEGDEDG